MEECYLGTMNERQAEILERLQKAGGLKEGAARQVARATGVPEATVYGAGSFFHLLSEPDVKVRVSNNYMAHSSSQPDF